MGCFAAFFRDSEAYCPIFSDVHRRGRMAKKVLLLGGIPGIFLTMGVDVGTLEAEFFQAPVAGSVASARH